MAKEPANAVAGVKGFVSISLERRFWAKVDRRGPDECWPWLGSCSRRYGTIFDNGRNRRATQVAWEIHNKAPFPSGLHACHSCDNPQCVNPYHIWPGTARQNIQDALRKGRLNLAVLRSYNYNRDKTVCYKGHPLSGDNLGIRKDGRRACRACQRRLTQESLKRHPRRSRARAALIQKEET